MRKNTSSRDCWQTQCRSSKLTLNNHSKTHIPTPIRTGLINWTTQHWTQISNGLINWETHIRPQISTGLINWVTRETTRNHHSKSEHRGTISAGQNKRLKQIPTGFNCPAERTDWKGPQDHQRPQRPNWTSQSTPHRRSHPPEEWTVTDSFFPARHRLHQPTRRAYQATWKPT